MASDGSGDEVEFDETKTAEFERDASSSRARGRTEKEIYNSESPASNDDEEDSVGRYSRRATSKMGGRRKRKASLEKLTHQRRARASTNSRQPRHPDQGDVQSRRPQKSSAVHSRHRGNRTGAPGLAIALETDESRMRAVVGEGSNIHYGEDLAVKNYVRHCIYPKKKTFFSEREYRFGSPLAERVINFILYDRKGHYKMQPTIERAAKTSMEIAFWSRVMDLVRKVLKEKLNNSLSRFREKFESKMEWEISCDSE